MLEHYVYTTGTNSTSSINRFKKGDLVVYKENFLYYKPMQLIDSFVYRIQDIDDIGNYYLLPQDNYLKISGTNYNKSTWICKDNELDSLADRSDCFWGEAEEKMYGAESSMDLINETNILQSSGYNPRRRSTLQEDIMNHG